MRSSMGARMQARPLSAGEVSLKGSNHRSRGQRPRMPHRMISRPEKAIQTFGLPFQRKGIINDATEGVALGYYGSGLRPDAIGIGALPFRSVHRKIVSLKHWFLHHGVSRRTRIIP